MAGVVLITFALRAEAGGATCSERVSSTTEGGGWRNQIETSRLVTCFRYSFVR